MKRNSKKFIAASALFLCLSAPAFAEEPQPTESGVLVAAEEMAETRSVRFVVREDTAMEVDGERLSGPSEKRGTTWFYDAPALKLGRHHVKLTHPRTNSWEAVLVVTKDYPAGDGEWNLSDKLDYGRVHEKEEPAISKNEIWMAPQSGRVQAAKAALYSEPTETSEKVAELTEGTEISIFGKGALSGKEMKISAARLTVTLEDGSAYTLTEKDAITLLDRDNGNAQCEIEVDGVKHTFITAEGNLTFIRPWYHVEVLGDAPCVSWVEGSGIVVGDR